MIIPAYLKTGDTVIILSTARKVDEGYIVYAMQLLINSGLNVLLGKHLYDVENQFAGKDEERLADFQQALDDPNIKAIFCARGGYGTIRILDQLRFEKFNLNPKWLIGYSDITVLHCHFQNHLHTESLHASMPVNFNQNSMRSLQLMKDTLFGKVLSYQLQSHPLNRAGNSSAEMVGGNLSILCSLNGSQTFPHTRQKILFLEDIDEYLYHIDRMMINLKRAGVFEGLSGLIIGGMSNMHDNEIPFGKTALEIIADIVSAYDFPLCFNFPAGHIDDNCPVILGRKIELIVEEKLASVRFNS